MRASHVAVALCVLGALVPSAIAGMDAAPMFSEWFHAQKAGPSTRAKAMGGYEEAHTKHICLQETQQYNCRYVGCPAVNFAADSTCTGSPTCDHCRQGTVYQSDLTCCGSEHQYGYGDDDGNEGFGSGVAAPTLKIGTCDWDIDLYRDREDQIDFTRKKQIWPPSLLGATKVGTAWATCYLTAAAEYCGDVLCDKMVLSFKGGVYRAPVKSTLAEDLQSANPELSCLDEEAFNPSPEPAGRRRANVTLTDGMAEIISGVVTITSLDRTTEYSTGYMDYVAKFTPFDVKDQSDSDNQAPLSPSQYPTVTPNTYNLKLVSSGAGPVSA